jgi:tRNA uracil 4-sulfurtransferase
MTKKILIRFGEMMLKGRNIGFFIKKVRFHITSRLNHLNVKFELRHDRIFIDYENENELEIINILKTIPGIHSFSLVYVANPSLEDIIKVGIEVLNQAMINEYETIKIVTKRQDKLFNLTSDEITKYIASPILSGANKKYIVDVKHPKNILRVDLRVDKALIYLNSIKGMGGYPYQSAGLGYLMMSGGLDSAVAGYLAIKQGVEIELIHFESTPMTSIESVQKVIDLARKLAVFTPNHKIKLHLIPFKDLHEEILNKAFDSYIITIMRRMMYRLAEMYTRKKKVLCIINGESIGQVASQTLQSLNVIERVTKIPIIRPLITYDKEDIITIAKQIDTYSISIKPFNDCCSIYVPKAPVTKPMEIYALKYEKELDYEKLLEKALSEVIVLELDTNTEFDLTSYGFTTSKAYENYMNKESDNIDHI